MKMTKEVMEVRMELAEETQKRTAENYRRLNKVAKKGQILFTGSSLMEQFPVCEIAMNHELGKIVYNRGIGGFTSVDFIENIDAMLFGLEPKYIFTNIGTNDLRDLDDGTPWQVNLEKNLTYILGQIKERLPETQVYMMAYYPMNDEDEEFREFAKLSGTIRTNKTLEEAREIEKRVTGKFGYNYIDVNEGLTDENGNLKAAFCKDAVHFYPDGYEIVYRNLEKYLEECK